MSLSGNLGFVPIDEILRLLTRAKQQGSVDVSGNGFYGRIFVGKGGIDLATTASDDELATQLVNSGVADDDMLRRVGMGETTLAAVAESNQEVIELIREITVESLYQISDQGMDFSVREAFTTPYASPKAFELEALLHDARTRERDWAKVSETISDLDRKLAMNRNVGGDEVSMKADDWRVLSQIGGGASVNEIAWNLGTTSFWTARVAARLVSNELVKVEEAMVKSQPEPEYEPVHYETPSYDETPESVHGEDEVAETVFGSPVADPDTTDDQEFSFSISTSDETTEDVTSESDESSIGFAYGTESVEVAEATSEDVETTEAVSEDHDVDANKSWWEEPADEAEEVAAVEDDDVEDDSEEEGTEAFLEKVFSELDSGDDGDDSSEGHGLLRRRRMGTLRDFSSDS